MKLMTMRTKVQLFVAVVLTAGLFAGWANAQSLTGFLLYNGKFTLPNETHWGKAVLPAGDYSISMDSERSPALVRSNDGKTTVFTPLPIGDDGNNGNKGPTALIIAARGNQREVLSMNLPTLGSSLVYKRLTKAEHEMTAKVEHVQIVPAKAARN
jgi:hypothetical protein